MHFSRDKHQYYFEKYLRKEMKGEELDSFEKKLAENEKFKSYFDYYVSNRSEIVEDGLAEYDEPELLKAKPQKWGWLYAVISILCLVLIIDYYFTASYSGNLISNANRKPLIDKINIFKNNSFTKDTVKEIPTKTKEEKVNRAIAADSAKINAPVDPNMVQYMEGNRLAIQGDYFVIDSIFKVVDATTIQERTKMLRVQTDSLLDDSALRIVAIKSYYKNPNMLSKQLLVEYWESPIHFRGYLFNGKKLLIYGIESFTPLYLSFSEATSAYHLFVLDKEFYLFPDNQFHQLAEE